MPRCLTLLVAAALALPSAVSPAAGQVTHTPPAQTSPRPPLAQDPRPRIVCFGDSLTAGYGTDFGESYPDDLQRLLDSSGEHVRVVNEGISGNTTKDGLARINRVLALHPALVIVEFGGNDGLRGVPIADSRANLDAILSTLQRSGTRIALAGITLPPSYGADYIRQFDETYTVLAKKYRVPLLPFLLKGVYGVPGMMQADGIHATAQGNQVVAHSVLDLIRPELRRLSSAGSRTSSAAR